MLHLDMPSKNCCRFQCGAAGMEWVIPAFSTIRYAYSLLIIFLVAMPAAPFTANHPLRFRGIPDSLASSHLEGSECCLIHADNPLSTQDGIYMNPLVRVGYSGPAYVAVNPIMNWLSARSILQGLWINRIRRWTTSTWLKDKFVQRRIDRWTALSPDNREPGRFCIIDEMQVLHAQGWDHL